MGKIDAIMILQMNGIGLVLGLPAGLKVFIATMEQILQNASCVQCFKETIVRSGYANCRKK